MGSQGQTLLNFKQFLRHFGEVFNVDFSVILWDGDRVPLCEHPTSDLALRLYDPGVVTSMLRSPRRLTQIELFMNGRIRIVNGTLFDMEPRRQDIENKVRAGLLRKIDKWLAFKALSHFYFASRQAPAPKLAFEGVIPDLTEKGRNDKALI